MMKPARGSGRASTRGPRGAKERNSHKTHQKSIGRAESPHPQLSQRSSAMVGKSKNQRNWKPLTKSSMLALRNMFDMSILSVLTLKTREKEESQKHLNLIKDQFLAKCAQLSVPPRKRGDMMGVSRQFSTESKKSEHGKKTLQALEESMSSIVSTLEEMEVKMDRLQEKCRIMRSRIEEEEDNAQEFLHLSEQTVLHLPTLQSRSANEPTLQEQLMQTVPNPPAVVEALHPTPVLEDVRVFLQLAHKQVDHAEKADHNDETLD